MRLVGPRRLIVAGWAILAVAGLLWVLITTMRPSTDEEWERIRRIPSPEVRRDELREHGINGWVLRKDLYRVLLIADICGGLVGLGLVGYGAISAMKERKHSSSA